MVSSWLRNCCFGFDKVLSWFCIGSVMVLSILSGWDNQKSDTEVSITSNLMWCWCFQCPSGCYQIVPARTSDTSWYPNYQSPIRNKKKNRSVRRLCGGEPPPDYLPTAPLEFAVRLRRARDSYRLILGHEFGPFLEFVLKSVRKLILE